MKRLLLTLGICLMAAPLSAAPVTILNPGFENPPLANGAWTTGWIPDWGIDSGMLGVFDPSAVYFLGQAPEGENVAWVQGGSFYQMLTLSVEANVPYRLTFLAGRWSDLTGTNFSASLLAGTTAVATATWSGNQIPLKTFEEFWFEVSLGSSPYVGQPLGIRLSGGAAGKEVDFDNVRFEAVPEPASLLLLGTGLVALRFRRRPRN